LQPPKGSHSGGQFVKVAIDLKSNQIEEITWDGIPVQIQGVSEDGFFIQSLPGRPGNTARIIIKSVFQIKHILYEGVYQYEQMSLDAVIQQLRDMNIAYLEPLEGFLNQLVGLKEKIVQVEKEKNANWEMELSKLNEAVEGKKGGKGVLICRVVEGNKRDY
jgi:hypothetical protein